MKSNTIMLLFEDRNDAAKRLAKRLEEWLKRGLAITSKVQEEEQEPQKYGTNIIVLAISTNAIVDDYAIRFISSDK